MHCSKCGSALSTSDKFCNQCGTPIHGQKERSPWPVTLVVLFFLLVVIIALSQSIGDNAQSHHGYTNVTYRVTGSAQFVDVSFTNATNGMDHHSVSLPYAAEEMLRAGDHAYVTAQNHGELGDVTVEILLDGISVKTATSNGEYCIASTGLILP